MKALETTFVTKLLSEQWTVISLHCPSNYQGLLETYFSEGYDDLILEDDINRYLDYRINGIRLGPNSRAFHDRLLSHSHFEAEFELFWLDLWKFFPPLPPSTLVIAYAKPSTSRVDLYTHLRIQPGTFPGIHTRPQLQNDFDSYRRIRLRDALEARGSDAMERSSTGGCLELELPFGTDIRPDGDLL